MDPTDHVGRVGPVPDVHDSHVRADGHSRVRPFAPVLAEAPLLVGRDGVNTCSHGLADRVTQRFEDRGHVFPGRTRTTWNPSSGPSTASDYDGTPTPYEIGLRGHPRALDS
ncbi:hypothetical protein AB0G71_11705 [Streptomyces sp. NPDC020403]|uniref:hypothetical protein n=1 Tax=unclassified Streptomyces TaxID=2593676 RepID=UPI003405BCB8